MIDRKGAPEAVENFPLAPTSGLADRSHLAPKAVAISNQFPLLVLGALLGKREECGSQAVSQSSGISVSVSVG